MIKNYKTISLLGLILISMLFSMFYCSISYSQAPQSITIYYNASTGGGQLINSPKVYCHSGAGTNVSNCWNYVVGNWGQDDGIGQMTNNGTNLWKLVINNINNYYNQASNGPVVGTIMCLGMVFRNADGSVEGSDNGNDIYIYFNSDGSITSSFAGISIENNCASIINNPISQYIDACSASTNFTVNASGNNISYQWQIDTGLGFIDLTNNIFYSGINTNTLTVSNINLNMNLHMFRCKITSCQNYIIYTTISTLYVTIGYNQEVPICLVTVDSASQKNVIIWEKPTTAQIDEFLIQKEIMTNVYENIATIPYSSLSLYIDTNSNPAIQAIKYKLVVKDVCGNITESSPHKTLHLLSNTGINNTVNLSWSNYEGVTIPAYKIYRADPISLPMFTLIGTVPGNNTTFSDQTPPNELIYYFIEFDGVSCNPTRSFTTGRSNIISHNLVSTHKQSINGSIELNYSIDNNILSLIINSNYSYNSKVLVYNLFGQLIFNSDLEVTPGRNTFDFDISHIPMGTYLIKTVTDNENQCNKFIKQ